MLIYLVTGFLAQFRFFQRCSIGLLSHTRGLTFSRWASSAAAGVSIMLKHLLYVLH